MRMRARCALAALLVCGSLAGAVGSAHANRLEVSSLQFRMTWGRVFRLSDTGGTVECVVTLTGSFHSRSFPKVTSVLIGLITGATIQECSGGSAGFLAETLPWHVQYEGFSGTLPNIELFRIQITEAGISLRTGFVFTCLARASATNPLKMTVGLGTENRLTAVRLVEAAIPYRESTSCTGLNLVPVRQGTGEFFELFGNRMRLFLI